MFSRPKILFLVSLLFVALLNSIPTYPFEFLIFFIVIKTRHLVFEAACFVCVCTLRLCTLYIQYVITDAVLVYYDYCTLYIQYVITDAVLVYYDYCTYIHTVCYN